VNQDEFRSRPVRPRVIDVPNGSKQDKDGERLREKQGQDSPTMISKICANSRGRCLCCGTRLTLTADHVIPLSEGGTHAVDNIQPLCRECNSRKHTLTVDFRRKKNRLRFLASKTGNKRHILRTGEARTLCGLHAYEPVGFSEITDDLPLCRTCKWSLRSELERSHTKQVNE
jgi:5-methylcytosine-specific restriction endonuclease McrA